MEPREAWSCCVRAHWHCAVGYRLCQAADGLSLPWGWRRTSKVCSLEVPIWSFVHEKSTKLCFPELEVLWGVSLIWGDRMLPLSCFLVLMSAHNIHFSSLLSLDNTPLTDKRDERSHKPLPLHLPHNPVPSIEAHLVSVALLLSRFYSHLVHLTWHST